MATEFKFKSYNKSHKDEKYRFAIIGMFTIDIKRMEAFLTSDPENEDGKFSVERSETHYRDSISDPSRF